MITDTQKLILKILYVEKRINNKGLDIGELLNIINNSELVKSYESKFQELKALADKKEL